MSALRERTGPVLARREWVELALVALAGLVCIAKDWICKVNFHTVPPLGMYSIYPFTVCQVHNDQTKGPAVGRPCETLLRGRLTGC